MPSRIITIGGPPGSGTSTVSRNVADELGYSRFSSGDFMRNIARQKGVSLQEINNRAETNTEIDRQVDQKVKNLADSHEVVVDSRLGFHFIPECFAVYLEVDLETAARRVYNEREAREKTGELASSSLEETRERIIERLTSERQRYKELYNIDHTNHEHYNLIVDTDTKDVPGVVNTIVSKYKDWLQEENDGL